MLEVKFLVTDDGGIHARPAAELVKTVNGSDCGFAMASGPKAVNNNAGASLSIMALMCACFLRNEEVAVQISSSAEAAESSLLAKLEGLKFWKKVEATT